MGMHWLVWGLYVDYPPHKLSAGTIFAKLFPLSLGMVVFWQSLRVSRGKRAKSNKLKESATRRVGQRWARRM